jgi:hypothetical protein
MRSNSEQFQSQGALQEASRSVKQAITFARKELKMKPLQRSPWMGRARAPQELVFSRRAIICIEQAVWWECHCVTRHSAMGIPESNDLWFSRFSTSIIPDLYQFRMILKHPCLESPVSIEILPRWLHLRYACRIRRRGVALAARRKI